MFVLLDTTFYFPQGQGFMVGVKINPVPGLPSGFPVIFFTLIFLNIYHFSHSLVLLQSQIHLFTLCVIFEQELLKFVLAHVEDKNVEPLLEVRDMVVPAFSCYSYTIFLQIFLYLIP